MAAEDLIDISKRPDFKEITSRGGSAKSEKKSFAIEITSSGNAKCKKCELKCDFKNTCLMLDPESKCQVPTMRASAKRDGTGVVRWDDKKVEMYLVELLNMYKKLMIDDDKFETEPKKKKIEMARDLNVMYNRLLQFKQAYHPPTQKTININIETTADKVIERLRNYKLQKQKEQIVVCEENGEN